VLFPRIALAVLLALVLAPLINLVAIVPPSDLGLMAASPELHAALGTSLAASFAATAAATVLGVPAGYALARAGTAARGAGLAGLAVPLALPPVASGVALLGLVGHRQPLGAALAARGFGLVDTFGGVALAEFFVSATIVAIAATAAFSAVDASSEEAARTLGAGPWRVLLYVAVPPALPAISAGVLLAWLRALGEYGATSIVAYHPASLPIALAITLSADGVPRALALTEAFAALAVVAAACVTLARRTG
jgi:molybdate/tungstate transport system permease protein